MPAPKDPQKREEWLRKISANKKGKKLGPRSEEHTRKIIEKQKGRPGRKQSEAEKVKRSATMKALYKERGDLLSPEGRARSTAANRARPPRKQSEAEKAKRAASLKARHEKHGDPLSPEARARVTAFHTGRKRSPETRAKTTMANRAKAAAMTEEQKAKENVKRSASLKTYYETHDDPRSPEALARIGTANKARKRSPETRAKLAQISRAQWEAMTDEQKAAKSALLQSSTQSIRYSTLEQVVAAELEQQGIQYEQQFTIRWYRVDFYLPATRTVIECAGCYWHGCEACGYSDRAGIRAKDAKRFEYLQSKGYTVKVIWEHEREREINALRYDKETAKRRKNTP